MVVTNHGKVLSLDSDRNGQLSRVLIPLVTGGLYGCDIWSGRTNYSAVGSPGELLSRGDCPRRDSLSANFYKPLVHIA